MHIIQIKLHLNSTQSCCYDLSLFLVGFARVYGRRRRKPKIRSPHGLPPYIRQNDFALIGTINIPAGYPLNMAHGYPSDGLPVSVPGGQHT